VSFFDLAVEGIARLRRMTPFGEEPIAYEPLSGLVNGSNTRFRTRKGPVKPNSLTAYISGGSVPVTLTDPDVVTFNTAPVAQPYASYVHQPLSDLRAKQLLMDGVTELEIRWPRGWRLSSSSVAYVAAAEADTNIFVLDDDTVADPSNAVDLSTSENQKALVVSCALFVYRMAQGWRMAMAAVSLRGTAGGITVDRRSIPQAMEKMLERSDARLKRQIVSAATEWTNGASLGGAIMPIHTRDYMQQYEWQSSSTLQGWRTTYQYDPSDVDLEAI